MKHTHLTDEIDAHEGNDWIGMFFAVLAALVVATLIIDVATQFNLHNWIADAFISLVEMV